MILRRSPLFHTTAVARNRRWPLAVKVKSLLQCDAPGEPLDRMSSLSGIHGIDRFHSADRIPASESEAIQILPIRSISESPNLREIPLPPAKKRDREYLQSLQISGTRQRCSLDIRSVPAVSRLPVVETAGDGVLTRGTNATRIPAAPGTVLRVLTGRSRISGPFSPSAAENLVESSRPIPADI